MRQYVGARYVPKLFTNPIDNSNDWLSGTSYEALTIVTYNNTSYTSKKPVPASVGSPNSNPEYWVVTGNYNGQVEEYRQEVENIADDLTDVNNDLQTFKGNYKNRSYIFIGDSYEANYAGNGWCEGCRDRLDVQASKITSAGGASFTGRHEFPTFISLLNGVYGTMSSADKLAVTDVVVCGGLNDVANLSDGTKTNAQLVSAMAEFADRVHAVSPKAMVHVGFIGGYKEGSDYLIQGIDVYKRAGYSHKYLRYIDNVEYFMVLKSYYAEDGVHPLNASVSYSLGTYIAAALKDCMFVKHALAPTFSVNRSNFALVGNHSFYETLYNDLFSIYLTNELELTVVSSSITGRNAIEIGSFSDDLFKGHKVPIQQTCSVQVFGANNELLGLDNGILYYVNNKVSWVPQQSWSNVTKIVINRTNNNLYSSTYACF